MERIIQFLNQAKIFINSNWSFFERTNYYFTIVNNIDECFDIIERYEKETFIVNKLSLLKALIDLLSDTIDNMYVTIFLEPEDKKPIEELFYQSLQIANNMLIELSTEVKKEIPEYKTMSSDFSLFTIILVGIIGFLLIKYIEV